MIDDIETRLEQAVPEGPTPELRSRVLGAVEHELRGSGRGVPWGRLAAALLLVSIGLNYAVIRESDRRLELVRGARSAAVEPDFLQRYATRLRELTTILEADLGEVNHAASQEAPQVDGDRHGWLDRPVSRVQRLLRVAHRPRGGAASGLVA